MRVGVLVAVLAATVLAPATAGAATTIGNRLFEAAQDEIGVCGFSGVTIVDRSCTVAQAGENPQLVAAGGETAPFSGVVVRWRIVTGIAPIGTESIAARLHPLAGETGGIAESAYTSIPLHPGLHEFASRLPIVKGEQLALDTRITNDGNEYAGLPIVHYASEAGSPVEWSPALGEGETREPGFFTSPTSSYDLMLNADIEPDADHDGYGDETQDGCPTDPTRHGACFSSNPPPKDTTPPRTKLTYPVHQDFLAKKSVLLRLRSNEDATALASGQLEYAKEKGKAGRVIYGLRGVKREVTAGAKTTLRLRLPAKTRRAGARAIALGMKVVVKVTVTATDAAGNRSGATVAVIHPKG
jgi:hypothetical protein